MLRKIVMLLEIAKLTRIEHGVMYSLAVLAAVVFADGLSNLPLFVLLIPLLSEMGAFALNDYFDIEADRKNNRKDRPLATASLSPSFALLLSSICITIAIALSFFVNQEIFMLTVALNSLAILYNLKLKLLPLVGNFYIAFTMGIPFIFGNLIVSQEIKIINLVLFLLGFIVGLARELIKSIEDMKGDKEAREAMTLPILIGEKPTLALALLLYLMFIPLSFLPFYFGLNINIFSTVLFSVAIVLVAANIFYAVKNQYKKARVLSLIALFFGLLAYLASVVI